MKQSYLKPFTTIWCLAMAEGCLASSLPVKNPATITPEEQEDIDKSTKSRIYNVWDDEENEEE